MLHLKHDHKSLHHLELICNHLTSHRTIHYRYNRYVKYIGLRVIPYGQYCHYRFLELYMILIPQTYKKVSNLGFEVLPFIEFPLFLSF